MSGNFNGIKKGRYAMVIIALHAHIQKAEEGGYVSFCPELGVYSQGETLKEARANIIEASELFVESCVARGVLEEILTRRNLRKVGNKAKSQHKPVAPPNRVVPFRTETPMFAY